MKQKTIKQLKQVKRKGMDQLIKFLEESDYFTAPASTRFHASYEGGLLKHSWNVYELFKQKNKQYHLELKEESIILCAFLHDLCKVNLYSQRILKNGSPAKTPYVSEEDFPLGHSSKSLFIISRFIELTEEEALIIRWHMSWSDYEFKKYIDNARKVSPAIFAFVCSDIEASEYLDDGGDK